jgi:hypothetical protein
VCAGMNDGGTWLLDGKWYYEVVIEHAGSASIGWTTGLHHQSPTGNDAFKFTNFENKCFPYLP